ASNEATSPATTVEGDPKRCGAPGGRTQPVSLFVSGATSKLGHRCLTNRANDTTSPASTPTANATHTCRPPPPEAHTTCSIRASPNNPTSNAPSRWTCSAASGVLPSKSKHSNWNRPRTSARCTAHGNSGTAPSTAANPEYWFKTSP